MIAMPFKVEAKSQGPLIVSLLERELSLMLLDILSLAPHLIRSRNQDSPKMAKLVGGWSSARVSVISDGRV
jgi:hypothetical protein